MNPDVMIMSGTPGCGIRKRPGPYFAANSCSLVSPKKNGMWQISLVVVVNRHGDGAEPKHDYPLGHACFGEHVPESVLTKLARGGLIGLPVALRIQQLPF